MKEWIKCSDRMPEEGEDVLLFVSWYGFAIVLFDHNVGMFEDATGQLYPDATHWMPLPEPPS